MRIRPALFLFAFIFSVGLFLPVRACGQALPARVLLVACHPDDEDFVLLSSLAEKGAQTFVIFMTRGERGRNLVNGRTGSELGRLREAEARRAAEILGVEQVLFLDNRDFGYTDSIDLARECWDEKENIELLVYYFRTIQPHLLFIAHDEKEDHGQHGFTARVARAACRLAPDPGYTISTGDVPDLPRLVNHPAVWSIPEVFQLHCSENYLDHAGSEVQYGPFPEPVLRRAYRAMVEYKSQGLARWWSYRRIQNGHKPYRRVFSLLKIPPGEIPGLTREKIIDCYFGAVEPGGAGVELEESLAELERARIDYTARGNEKQGNGRRQQAVELCRFYGCIMDKLKAASLRPREIQIDLIAELSRQRRYIEAGIPSVGLLDYSEILDCHLENIGMRVERFTGDEIKAGRLQPFSTVIIGQNMYFQEPGLGKHYPELLNYVKSGGNLVILSQLPELWQLVGQDREGEHPLLYPEHFTSAPYSRPNRPVECFPPHEPGRPEAAIKRRYMALHQSKTGNNGFSPVLTSEAGSLMLRKEIGRGHVWYFNLLLNEMLDDGVLFACTVLEKVVE